MLLELSRAVSFFLCILSLYWVMLSAFFVPGSRWQERLTQCLFRAVLAACVCFASGLLFSARTATRRTETVSPLSTLPVRLYCWGMGAIAILFFASWYLEEYYIPWAKKG
jgi:hypothetical protein